MSERWLATLFILLDSLKIVTANSVEGVEGVEGQKSDIVSMA